MYTNSRQKVLNTLISTGITNGGTGSARFDTLGGRHLKVVLALGTADATNSNPTVLKLMEADDTTTSRTNISGTVGGTDFTIGNSLTTGLNNYVFNVDLRGRKRYITILASPVTTQSMHATGLLDMLEDAPDTATEAGGQNLVSV